MQTRHLLILLLFLIHCIDGDSQSQPWTKLEITPSFSSAKGKIESVGQGELIYLAAGELYHVRYDSDFNMDVKILENQVTEIQDFILIDVDWDGDKDIMAIITDGPIQVYENLDNSFEYNISIKIFNWIKANTLSLHDFNDDGHGDILLNNILYVATGPNTFEKTHTSYPDNYIPKVAQFFDYDLDGDKDLLMILVSNLFILENKGTTGLVSKSIPDFLNKTSWAKVIRAGNKNVIIVYSGGDKKFYRIFYENNTFGHKEIGSYTHTQQNYSIVASDLDNDGVDELISDQYYNQLTILKYDTLSDTLAFYPYSSPNYLSYTVGDQSGNQIIIRYSGQIEGVIWDKNENTLVRKFLSPTIFTPSQYLDIDGDGFVDLVKGFSIKQYLGERNFNEIKSMSIDSTGGQWKDFDGDGDLDYVLKKGWYKNVGGLEFDPYQSRTPDPIFVDPQIFFTNIVFREDLDGDGDIDVLTYNRFGEPLELYENIGGDFTMKQTLVTNNLVSGYLRGLRFEDFDGDGKRDILISAASGMAWMKNLGSLVFSGPMLLYDGIYSPLMMDVGDVNEDGIQDIVLSTGEIITGATMGSIWLYLGSSDAILTPISVTQGKGYHRAIIANLDKAGWKDIVFSKDDGIFTIHITGASEMVTNRINFDPKNDSEFVIQDLDGDEDDDIICANQFNSLFYIINGSITSIDCPKGSVFLRNQDQVDAFIDKYGSCPVIPGDLFLGLAKNINSNINNIEGLSNIQKIEGSLTIHYSPSIQNFLGFINLDSIGESLILNRFSTKNLKGFDNLGYIGKHLELTHAYSGSSDFILDTRELGNVKYIGGNIKLTTSNFTNLGIQSQPEYFGDISFSIINFNNNLLTNIDFLKNTRKIHGSLDLGRCNVTTLEPAKKLEEVGEFIVFSTQLHTNGIGSKIDSIKGSLVISGSDQFELFSDTSFANLKYVGNKLELYAKSLKGFSNVEKVMGTLAVAGDTIDIGFLDKIYFIGENLSLGGSFEVAYPGFLQEVDSIPGYINFLTTKFNNLSFLSSIKKAGSLDLNQNSAITSLEDLHPELSLDGRLLIWRCPNLNFCDVPFVCKHIADGKLIYLNNNGIGCNDPLDLDCLVNTFSGNVFYDANENGEWDDHEFPVSGQKVKALEKPIYSLTSTMGKYRHHFLPKDTVNVSLWNTNDFKITSTLDRFTGRFEPGLPSNTENHFGVLHRSPIHKVEIVGQVGLFVCFRPFGLVLNVVNQGSFPEKTRVKIQLPPSIRLDSIDTLTYDYDPLTGIAWLQTDSLLSFQRKNITLWMTAPMWDIDGENKYNISWILQVLDESGQWVTFKEKVETLELLCSYDPNDKLVEGPYLGSNLLYGKSDYLEYTIRFQNTGNYYAENVLLVDTLSSFLDVDSLILLSSSHEPMEMTLSGNILKFYFPNILLPDSTRDFTGSQGFVRFRVKTKQNLDASEEILNTAHIFFDYNEPITTNSVQSVVLLPDNLLNYENKSVKLWPIPARDEVWIQMNGESVPPDWNISVYSYDGQIVSNIWQPSQDFMNIISLNSGIYWVVFEHEGEVKFVDKFIKL